MQLANCYFYWESRWRIDRHCQVVLFWWEILLPQIIFSLSFYFSLSFRNLSPSWCRDRSFFFRFVFRYLGFFGTSGSRYRICSCLFHLARLTSLAFSSFFRKHCLSFGLSPSRAWRSALLLRLLLWILSLRMVLIFGLARVGTVTTRTHWLSCRSRGRLPLKMLMAVACFLWGGFSEAIEELFDGRGRQNWGWREWYCLLFWENWLEDVDSAKVPSRSWIFCCWWGRDGRDGVLLFPTRCLARWLLFLWRWWIDRILILSACSWKGRSWSSRRPTFLQNRCFILILGWCVGSRVDGGLPPSYFRERML